MDVSVDLGPSAKADAGTFLEDDGGNRLLIVTRKGVLLFLFGLGLIAAAAGSLASLVSGRFEWWEAIVGIGLGILGGWLLFGRNWIRLDRKRRLLETGVSIISGRVRRRHLLGKYTRVVVRQDDSVSTDSDGHSTTTTTFPVTLQGGPGVSNISLTSAGIWEAAIPVAEAVSRFLGVPMVDQATKRTQQPDELDLALRDQAPPARPVKKHSPPRSARSVVLDQSEQSLTVAIPRPQARQYLALVALIAVLWCLPVGLLSRSLIPTFLPLAVVLATAIKCVLGYRSEFEVTPQFLRVKTFGLILRRTVSFPADELEDLLVRGFEQGGPRTALAQMMDGVIIARSDWDSVRFGHGLAWGELQWLRQEIHRIITSASDSEPPPGVALDHHPRVINWATALIGWLSGAALAAVFGGYLAIGVALPFLEHLLNLGAVLGLFCGLAFLSTRYQRARSITGGLLLATLVVFVVADLAGWIQTRPSFDGYRWLRQGERDHLFWIGWIPIAAGISLLLAEALQWAIRLVARVRR